MENNMLLSIKDLVVEYTSDGEIVHAANGISFNIGRGETLGLVGETGAGKTTIAKSILRILPDRGAKVKGGSVVFEGQDLMEISEKEMRSVRGNKISMIFQDPMTALNPVMKVGQQVANVIELHSGVSKKVAIEKAGDMLEMVGITRDRMNEYPHQFSGGMKQRVIIAMALSCNPDLILADEPTTALDVTIQAQVLEMIDELKRKNNTAMLLITHDLGIVAENCDKVAVIYAGEIVEYGNKEDVFIHPAHPYTLGLFDSLPSMNDDSEWLKPIKGAPADPTNLPSGCKFHPRCPYASERCGKGDIPVRTVSDGHYCKCLQQDIGKEA